MNSVITQTLKKGGIGIFPTDTLYGVVGRADNQKTVERIYTVKGRRPSKPLIILIASLSDLKKFGVSNSLIRTNKKILDTLWPGPVSIILPVEKKALKKWRYLHRGTNSLAFRMPRKAALRNFLKRTGPLVAPSANPEGEKPAETIAEAKTYFGSRVDFYLSGGRKKGNPSTLISLATKKPTLLRGELSKRVTSLFLSGEQMGEAH
jgi:L-threonylcarbamoyladenylate synthase